MEETGAKGLAIAVVDEGRVAYVRAYGVRDGAGEPLRTDTIMYGASLTKAVMAFITLQLVDAGKLSLDIPIAADLERPLGTIPLGTLLAPGEYRGVRMVRAPPPAGLLSLAVSSSSESRPSSRR